MRPQTGLYPLRRAASGAPQDEGLLAIFSSTGSRWCKNACGSSLIGKWPRPFMMMASLQGMLLATAIVSSGVQD